MWDTVLADWEEMFFPTIPYRMNMNSIQPCPLPYRACTIFSKSVQILSIRGRFIGNDRDENSTVSWKIGRPEQLRIQDIRCKARESSDQKLGTKM